VVAAARTTGRKRVLVTAANELFFESLVNLIGSVHHWEPELDIIAYDLGLTPPQHHRLAQYCRVKLRRFPWGEHPRHLRPEYRNYGWKVPSVSLPEAASCNAF